MSGKRGIILIIIFIVFVIIISVVYFFIRQNTINQNNLRVLDEAKAYAYSGNLEQSLAVCEKISGAKDSCYLHYLGQKISMIKREKISSEKKVELLLKFHYTELIPLCAQFETDEGKEICELEKQSAKYYEQFQKFPCFDTDGNNILSKSEIIIADITYTDSCIDQYTVSEAVCTETGLKFETMSCPVGYQCVNGLCQS